MLTSMPSWAQLPGVSDCAIWFVQALSLTANAYQSMGRTQEAVTTLQTCLAVLEKTGRDEGSVAGSIKQRLVTLLVSTGRNNEALAVVSSMLGAARNVHIPEHVATSKSVDLVAMRMIELGKPEAALPAAQYIMKARPAFS